jgi:hypothetical protein
LTRPICRHPGCTTCREIVVGLVARELAAVPEELRAGVCIEALRQVKAMAAELGIEATIVEEQIG